jgi:hypothetical protein
MGSAARPGEHGGGRERAGRGQWPACLALDVNDAVKASTDRAWCLAKAGISCRFPKGVVLMRDFVSGTASRNAT